MTAGRVAVTWLWLTCVGCTPGTVTRVVDGERREGRAISAEAYAAYAKAELFAAQGDRRHALELFAVALDQDPASPEIMTRYGEVLCAVEAGPKPLARFERALELDPEYAPAFLGRARCLSRLGRAQEALADARRAAYLDPMAIDTTRVVSELLFSGRRPDEAWRWLEARLLLEPESRAAQHLLLEAAVRERDVARAERARHALTLEHEPENRGINATTPGALLADPLRALEQAERRLAADPEDTGAWTTALVAADLLGDEPRFGKILALLGEHPLPLTQASLALLTELVVRRCGSDGARALSLAARVDLR